MDSGKGVFGAVGSGGLFVPDVVASEPPGIDVVVSGPFVCISVVGTAVGFMVLVAKLGGFDSCVVCSAELDVEEGGVPSLVIAGVVSGTAVVVSG